MVDEEPTIRWRNLFQRSAIHAWFSLSSGIQLLSRPVPVGAGSDPPDSLARFDSGSFSGLVSGLSGCLSRQNPEPACRRRPLWLKALPVWAFRIVLSVRLVPLPAGAIYPPP